MIYGTSYGEASPAPKNLAISKKPLDMGRSMAGIHKFFHVLPSQCVTGTLHSQMLNIYNNNNILTASGLSPGGSGYFTFKLRQTY
jgi:hypothetical protein